ncbi:hypothetical protein Tco_1055615 [Tanacetum coccineum]|uniref:DNA helicase Pif1-like 2B domain-containing protein n=1 Tax=Tanacetum coccineum TaxID=301880 RepID=A0ABQ5H058_9ASTR
MCGPMASLFLLWLEANEGATQMWCHSFSGVIALLLTLRYFLCHGLRVPNALRNLDPENGLCNGTRLICKRFDPNVIKATIDVGQNARDRVLLPRILLAPSEEDMFHFKLKRTQFPVRLGFLYVALSRGISRTTTKVLVKPVKEFGKGGVYTSNAVYQEVLRNE